MAPEIPNRSAELHYILSCTKKNISLNFESVIFKISLLLIRDTAVDFN